MSVSHTEGALCIARDAAKEGRKFVTFLIVILRKGTVDEVLARFPYVGTLKQAEAEAERLVSCFSKPCDAIVTAWYETERVVATVCSCASCRS